MLVAAFAYWKDRIAPVLDTARDFKIVEIREEKIIRETRESLAANHPFQIALRLAELRLDVLVCGAAGSHLQNLITAYGIRVFPFVSGELRPVIEAWIDGSLEKGDFAMPGCGRQKRRRRGRGSGRGNRHGRFPPNPS